MNVGIVLPVEGPAATPRAVVDVARLAETRGFHSVWATDRVLMPRTPPTGYPYAQARAAVAFDPERRWLEPLTTLSFAAAVTERVLLGTNVLVLPYRQPFVLAQEVASLDCLSDGRVLLGVGVGWMREEFHALGVDPALRGRQTDDWIALLRELWTGRHAFVLPASAGREGAPPVLVGGNSDAAFRRVARLGDGWLGVDLGPEETHAATEAIVAHARAHGRGRDDLTLSMRRRVDGADGASVRDLIDTLVGQIPAYAAAGVDLLVVDLLTTPDMLESLEGLAASLATAGHGVGGTDARR